MSRARRRTAVDLAGVRARAFCPAALRLRPAVPPLFCVRLRAAVVLPLAGDRERLLRPRVATAVDFVDRPRLRVAALLVVPAVFPGLLRLVAVAVFLRLRLLLGPTETLSPDRELLADRARGARAEVPDRNRRRRLTGAADTLAALLDDDLLLARREPRAARVGRAGLMALGVLLLGRMVNPADVLSPDREELDRDLVLERCGIRDRTREPGRCLGDGMSMTVRRRSDTTMLRKHVQLVNTVAHAL